MDPNSPPQPQSPSWNDQVARSLVAGPAVSLIIVSVVCLVTLLAALGFNVFLLAAGTVDQLADPRGMPKKTQVVLRMVFGMVLMVLNGVTLYGATQMKNLRSRGLAYT
ncbi:MAG: hypothetical protein ACREJB_11515, partial [Planctomycetaceae bacterium]